jgi:hypothetical protein
MKVRGGSLVAKTLKKYGVQDDLDGFLSSMMLKQIESKLQKNGFSLLFFSVPALRAAFYQFLRAIR